MTFHDDSSHHPYTAVATKTTPSTGSTLLARQLEYYFSQQNLSKDTYLTTLCELNDGCVPLAILANFGKVRLLTRQDDEQLRRQAVVQAVKEQSQLLHVVWIDTQTNTIVCDDKEDNNNASSSSSSSYSPRILAVGTKDKQPLILQQQQVKTAPSLASSSSFVTTAAPSSSSPCDVNNNTIMLRDVDPQVTKDDIKQLFQDQVKLIDGCCPSIVSIRPDIACCWYVELDTTSRDEMISILMRLRSCTLHGSPVQARFKASAPQVMDAGGDDAAVAAMAMMTMMMMDSSPTMAPRKKKKKKKKKHNKANKNSNNKKESMLSHNKAAEKKPTPPPPPSLETDFPTLQQQDNQVEWEPSTMQTDRELADLLEEGDANKEKSSKASSSSSDAASTATTASSSLDSSCRKLGGYAAAVLKPPSESDQQRMAQQQQQQQQSNRIHSSTQQQTNQRPPTTNKTFKGPIKGGLTTKHKDARPVKTTTTATTLLSLQQPEACSITIQPPSWGKGRSFADVMKSS